ncbi:molybdate transport system ATP-binding protein [Bryocella elongata]|uniref:Molybdate transport system ATP-binding protein n=1 Tax=Bryocella elongata TaxID=863522 RepID=A0A1H5ZQB4_9BACT|nr:ATP-binding cassette domain-containing protein [Bryocella elongata]SEG38194.1 molybdate transport system ATP-binding protein [Bryocella elongata]
MPERTSSPETAPRAPHHRLAVTATLGALLLSADLELHAPWTVLFGPSGSGKSSLLRAMCGFEVGSPATSIQFTRIASDGTSRRLDDVPSSRRDIAYAPQSPALLPHLDVGRNVSFPFEVCASPVRDSTVVDEALGLFKLHALAERRHRELSGGEAQRVNLARAFATPGAKLLLLDEPFNGIDRATRDALLPELLRVAAERGVPVVSVTHDVEEALRLEAEVVRIDAGRVMAQGPAREVLADEVKRIAAVMR